MPVLPGVARPDGFIVAVVTVVLATHGDAEGTIISGLRPDAPASVAADGMVASLYDPKVMVARPGIGATSVLLKNSVRFCALAAGLHMPFAIDGAKERLAGTVAPGRTGVASAPLIATALLASMMPLDAVTPDPAAAHVVTAPIAPGAIEADVPAPDWIAPSGLPGLAPSNGIVPSAGAGLDMVVGNVVIVVDDMVPGALRIRAEPTCWAKLESQPNMTMAAVKRIRLRIGASCV
jgi:hypothetical protein